MSVVWLVLLVVGVTVLACGLRGSIGCGIVDMRDLAGDDDVDRRLADLRGEYEERLSALRDGYEERILELENRVDFTERVLARRREPEALRLSARD